MPESEAHDPDSEISIRLSEEMLSCSLRPVSVRTPTDEVASDGDAWEDAATMAGPAKPAAEEGVAIEDADTMAGPPKPAAGGDVAFADAETMAGPAKPAVGEEVAIEDADTMVEPPKPAVDEDVAIEDADTMAGPSRPAVDADAAIEDADTMAAPATAPGEQVAIEDAETMDGPRKRGTAKQEALPEEMIGPQEWMLLPLPDEPRGIIGEGGEGVVYSYVQRELGREVAVKTLRTERWSYEAIEDLVREASVTARLEHPNIVPVHYLHLPEHDGDLPYWVMKRIKGKALTEHLPSGKTPWSSDRLLEVFRRILDAMAFAHSKGIVHRDLKPDNVLVGEFGEVQVSDWGLAVAINEDGARGATRLLSAEASARGRDLPRPPSTTEGEDTALTKELEHLNSDVRSGRIGALLNTSAGGFSGTPVYMAPEQLDMGAENISERTDVFLLGGILYAMLSGSPPHQLTRSGEGNVAQQRLDEIRSCSTIRSVVERRRDAEMPDTPEGLSEAALSGLWSIAEKALSCSPADRFESVPAMEAALDEWESRSTSQELCVQAATRLKEVASQRRPSARGYAEVIALADASLEKWESNDEAHRIRDDASSALATIQRRSAQRLWTAVAAIALVFIVGGVGYQRTRFQRNRAEEQKEKAERLAEAEAKQRKLADAERDNALREMYYANTALADQRIRNAHIGDAERLLDACPEQLRSWEWRRLKRLCHLDLLTLRGHGSRVVSVAVSPDGKRIASGSDDATVKIWDSETGCEVMTLKGHDGGVTSVAFSPDGEKIASASADSRMVIWDCQTGQDLMTLRGNRGWVTSVTFSPDGKRIASGNDENTVVIWSGETGRELMTLRGHNGYVSSVSFSPDGGRIASGSQDSTVKVWDEETGSEVMTLRGHSGGVEAVAFSPDGERIASASWDSTVKVWDGKTGREAMTLEGHSDFVRSVAFNRSGRRIASGSRDNRVKIWCGDTGCELLTLQGHTDAVCSVAFSRDGKQVVSGSEDRTVRVRDAEKHHEVTALEGHTKYVLGVALSPGGGRIASASFDRTVKVWDVETGREVMTLKGHGDLVWSVAFSRNGGRIASGSRDRTVKLWHGGTGRELMSLKGHRRAVRSVAFSPDGDRVASGSYDRTVRIWDSSTGRELRTLKGHRHTVESVAFSPDGEKIASGSSDRTVKLWDAETGRALRTLGEHSEGVKCVTFSPDGKRIASGSDDHTVKLWDAETERGLGTLAGHSKAVCSVAFSPGGERIASASLDRTVKVWDVQTGREVLTLQGHSHGVVSVAFSVDGERIASGSYDHTVRIWGAEPLLKAVEYLASAGEGKPEALHHLALVRERERRDAVARELHLKAIESAGASDQEWVELSRGRLESIPWLQRWWPTYRDAVSLVESGQHEAAVAAYRRAEALTSHHRERVADGLADGLVGLAQEHQNGKDYALAERLCRSALEIAPRSTLALVNLGLALRGKGKGEEAMAQYRRALEIDASCILAHCNLARDLDKSGNRGEAIVHYRKHATLALSGNKSGRYSARRCSQLLTDSEQIGEAIRVLEHWLEKDRAYAEGWLEMVDLYCASGRSENARSALSALLSPVWELEAAAEIRKEAVRKLARHLAVRAYSHCRKRAYDRAQTLAELAIEADPKSSFAHRALAYALDRKGLKEEAIAAYRRAIEVDANQVIAHYNLARLLAIEGSLDEAAHHYAQSAKLSKAGSKSARYAVRQCAQFLVKLGRADEAVQTLQEWLASDTEDVAARSDLAVLLWSGAGYGEARDVLDPLLSSKTPGVKVLLLAALVAQGNGEAGEAKNYLVRVLRSPVDWRTGHAVADLLDTGSDVGEALRPLVADDPAMASGLQERLAAGYAALAYRKATADDVAGAKADAQKAIQLAPDSAAVQSMAGSALGKAKSYREAVRCYSRAAKLEPKSPAHHASLGWCLYLAGRYDEAMMANKRALALNRTWAYANANVGLLHLLKGDLEAAMASYQKQVAIKGRATQPTIDLLLGIAQDKPEIKAVHYVLGFYYEKKGDQSKAREHYQRYVAAAKDGSFVEEAKKRVAELSPK